MDKLRNKDPTKNATKDPIKDIRKKTFNELKIELAKCNDTSKQLEIRKLMMVKYYEYLRKK